MRALLSQPLLATLVVFAALVASDSNAQQRQPEPHVAVLFIKRMPSPNESRLAIQELSKIAGIARVESDLKSRSLAITPKDHAFPSPLAIWETAESLQLQPVLLRTAHGVFTTKPK